MNQDHTLVQRFIFDTALLTGANAERLQRFTTICLGTLSRLTEAQLQAIPQVFDGYITRVRGMASDRNPAHMYAEWLSSMQTNQQHIQDALKQSIEILTAAQQVAIQMMSEAVDANSLAEFGGSNRMAEPINERRTTNVVIPFPDRRRTIETTTALSDAEVQMSAAILS